MDKRKLLFSAAIIGLVTFVVYLPALGNAFVDWDDPGYVIDNPGIRSLDFQSLKWMFTEYYFSNWHPLTHLSLAIDYAVWALDPWGYHLTNILLHAINTALVVLLAHRLFVLATGTSKGALQFSVIVGLLFGLHPIHVESVAWVSERKDLLYCLFYLSSIIFYLQYQARKQLSRYVICLLMFILSLLSKPMAVSLPLVLLVLDYYPLEKLRLNRNLIVGSVVDKLPMLALAFLSAFITFNAQHEFGSTGTMEIVPLGERLLLAQYSLWFYFYKTFVPVAYIYFYPMPLDITLANPQFLIPAGLNVLVLVFLFKLRNRVPLLIALAAIYVVTLLPVIGVVQVGAQAAADRYMYLTLLVPIILFASGIVYIQNNILTSAKANLAIYGALVFVFAALSYLTIEQIGVWKDTFSLANHALKFFPDNNHARTMRANVYFEREMYEEALADVNAVIEFNTRHVNRATHEKDKDHAFRGTIFSVLKMHEKAINDFTVAIANNNSNARYFVARAKAFEALEDSRLALMDYLRALELEPDNAGVNNDAALIHYQQGNYGLAVNLLDTAIRVKPDEGAFYFNRALNHNMLGDEEKAEKDLIMAAELGVQRAIEILKH